MNLDITLVILVLAGIGTGLIIGIFSQKGKNAKILESTTLEANDILRNAKQKAERIKDEKMLQAKERFIELKSEHEKVIFQREKKISDVEGRLRDKENKLNNDLNKNKNLSQSLEQKNETLQKRLVKLEHKQNELDVMYEQIHRATSTPAIHPWTGQSKAGRRTTNGLRIARRAQNQVSIIFEKWARQ